MVCLCCTFAPGHDLHTIDTVIRRVIFAATHVGNQRRPEQEGRPSALNKNDIMQNVSKEKEAYIGVLIVQKVRVRRQLLNSLRGVYGRVQLFPTKSKVYQLTVTDHRNNLEKSPSTKMLIWQQFLAKASKANDVSAIKARFEPDFFLSCLCSFLFVANGGESGRPVPLRGRYR